MVRLYPLFRAEKVLGVVASTYGTVIGAHGGGGSHFVGGQTIGLFRLPLAVGSSEITPSNTGLKASRMNTELGTTEALFIAVAAVEAVHVWEVRRARLVARLTSASVSSLVTCLSCTQHWNGYPSKMPNGQPVSSHILALSSGKAVVAVGYADGGIILYVLKSSDEKISERRAGEAINFSEQNIQDMVNSHPLSALGGIDHATLRLDDSKLFVGHRSGVSCLGFSEDSVYLASGSRNGDVTVWDIWSEQSIFQIRGLHADLVTSLRFVEIGKSAQIQSAMGFNERGALGFAGRLLLSSGKDAAIKVVDIATQECVQTLFGNRSEIWCLTYLSNRGLLVAGTNDGTLHMWRTSMESREGAQELPGGLHAHFVDMGLVHRSHSRARLLVMSADDEGRILICCDADRNMEFYEVRDEVGARSHVKRRRKRASKKNELTGDVSTTTSIDDLAATSKDSVEYEPQAADYLCLHLQTKYDIRLMALACISKSVYFEDEGIASVRLAVHRANNSISIERGYFPLSDQRRQKRNGSYSSKRGYFDGEHSASKFSIPTSGLESVLQVSGIGHHRPITALAFSDDFEQFLSAGSRSIPLPRVGSPLILSASNDIRIWNSDTGQCLCSIELADPGETTKFSVVAALYLRPPCDAGASFLEGKYAAIATDRGILMILDCEAGVILETTSVAVEETVPGDPIIRTMAQSASGDFLAVGGRYGFVSFYRLDFKNTDQKWKLREAPRLEVPNEVTAICFTPNQELVLVALMDMTVRAFRMDTLAFVLSFYGHKLPVMTMDVSGDSKLLVTGSADKSCRLWGLQFGDCIRSFARAHEDGVTVVRFDFMNPRCFWSGGRDGSLRYWDADLSTDRSCITTLEGRSALTQNGWGHRSGAVTALAVSGRGEYMASAGTDHSIRIWRRLEDQLVAGEEHENQLRELFEADALIEPERDYLGDLDIESDEVKIPQGAANVADRIERSRTAVENPR
ncbi:Dip2/Utp12 protein [Cyanidiococcus yangmingshanensis]|uniref:Dip2/Utp12 protein n=1 Tax=Cyanidiococcus yangmingshanensis TaxID=2690220 RepID=A0A7J7IG80_9RHOD|nr:Dip2/Utp12 protein [Cyanidiococcus yangmingshanensis]